MISTANPAASLILLFAAIIGGALAVGAAIFFLQRYVSPDPSLLQQRLERLKGKAADAGSEGRVDELPKTSRFYKDSDYKNEALGRRLEQFAFFRLLKLRMQQADIKTPPDVFFVNNLLLPVGLCTLLGLATGFFPLALLGPIVGAGVYVFVNIKRQQRYSRFIAQMPDALSMITSALRAGHSFQSALAIVAAEMPEPIGVEFSAMVRDVNLGIPVRDALVRLVNKLDALPDVCIFATAVTIQREAGGNLAEILENLGGTIRERFKLKGQIAALTGQSRLTGYVLGAAPAVMLTGLSLFMYSYVKPLYETDMGHLALLAAVGLQVVGFIVMRKVVDIRI
jgi:tight adherence protein B